VSSPLLYASSHRLARFVGRVDDIFGLLAALILVSLMLLTCADVVGRYVLDEPVPGAFEITELGMGALIFTSLPLVTWRRQQVTVDLLANLVPERFRPIQQSLLDLLAALCVGVIAWRLWIKAVDMAAAGETTATLRIPVYPLIYYMSIMTIFTTALILLLAWLDAAGTRNAVRANP